MDTVEVKITTSLQAFPVPDRARLVSGPDAAGEEGILVEIEDLDPDALDALAKRWLDNLYASARRSSPFEYRRPAYAVAA